MRSPRDFRLMRKLPRRHLSHMSTKPKNLKVSGLERPRLLQFCAAKRPNSISRVLSGCSDSENSASLSRISFQNLRASLSRLETDDDIVSISDHDHVARGLTPSPAFGPKIEDVVEVDVREHRRDHRTLTRPLLFDRCQEPFWPDNALSEKSMI